MALVHIRLIEDSRGDLVDLEYFHHEHAPDDVPGWPAPEATDGPTYCTACSERIDAVPMSRYGVMEYPELATADDRRHYGIVPDLYGPDGRPLDGPRTTAMQHAYWLATSMAPYVRGEHIHPLDRAFIDQWRGAAADEGSRYVEAIAGARAMRRWAYRNVPRPADLRRVPGGDAWDIERAHGIPTR